jgi:hypothetical protein
MTFIIWSQYAAWEIVSRDFIGSLIARPDISAPVIGDMVATLLLLLALVTPRHGGYDGLHTDTGELKLVSLAGIVAVMLFTAFVPFSALPSHAPAVTRLFIGVDIAFAVAACLRIFLWWTDNPNPTLAEIVGDANRQRKDEVTQ